MLASWSLKPGRKITKFLILKAPDPDAIEYFVKNLNLSMITPKELIEFNVDRFRSIQSDIVNELNQATTYEISTIFENKILTISKEDSHQLYGLNANNYKNILNAIGKCRGIRNAVGTSIGVSDEYYTFAILKFTIIVDTVVEVDGHNEINTWHLAEAILFGHSLILGIGYDSSPICAPVDTLPDGTLYGEFKLPHKNMYKSGEISKLAYKIAKYMVLTNLLFFSPSLDDIKKLDEWKPFYKKYFNHL